jgi:murein L,D-transpeptidase YcbB/YkuD
MDITDSWFKALGNAELAKYGLIKPMSYEPWHVQLIAHQGISQAQKEAIRDSIIGKDDGKVTVKEFQEMAGLTADGIVGPKTIAKAKEVQEVINKILGGKK